MKMHCIMEWPPKSSSSPQHLVSQCHGSPLHPLAAHQRWGQGTAMLPYCRWWKGIEGRCPCSSGSSLSHIQKSTAEHLCYWCYTGKAQQTRHLRLCSVCVYAYHACKTTPANWRNTASNNLIHILICALIKRILSDLSWVFLIFMLFFYSLWTAATLFISE